jgi:hypothetical protein
MSGDVRTNILDDLLDAERHFRLQAENALRELQGVLVEQAQRLAGAQLEQVRRLDPQAPENWNADRWRQFFASLPKEMDGDGWNRNLKIELERLKHENQSLRDRQAFSFASTVPVPAVQDPVGQDATRQADPRQGMPPSPSNQAQMVAERDPQVSNSQARAYSHAVLLGELRSMGLPTSLPVRFQSHFPIVGLNETDRARQVRRKLFALYLLSRGLDIRLEIDHLISQVEGIGSRSGALRRLYDGMVERNLASREVLEMSAPNTSLAMLQLTEEGRVLSTTLGWQVCESERQRIQRLHQGIQYPHHTLALLIFSMHARLRGYRVEVLPELEGVETRAAPDVAVTLDEAGEPRQVLYVEVEMSHKELDDKWRNLDQLQGRVALCARNIQGRARLVGDCKLKGLHGLATDLETLIACKVPEISTSTPLWAEEW